MNCWQGVMNWPISADWVCETCGKRVGLTWGFVHSECRCNACHTQYKMRDENRKIISVPISLLKEEYKEPAKRGWELYNVPISELSKVMWEVLLKL